MKREENLKLFQDREKNWITYGDLVRAMKEVKADDCDALLIHTDLSFGLPTRELKRKELVEVLYDAICELGVKTLKPSGASDASVQAGGNPANRGKVRVDQISMSSR